MTLPSDSCFTCDKQLVVSLRGTNTLFRHQYRINYVDHTVCTLDVGMNYLRIIYLNASVKQAMNFYLDGPSLNGRH
jgi:hypothetical protein